MKNRFEPRPANADDARDAGLRPLTELHDFKVSDDDPDVRGWTVRGSRGTDIGVVRDLLVDVAARRVRYMDVELFGVGEDSDTPSGRHVLIPIGAARLDDDTDIVRLPMATATNIRNLPNYQRMRFDRAYELSILGGLNSMAGLGSGGIASVAAAEDFYGSHYFDESTFYGARRRLGIDGGTRRSERR